MQQICRAHRALSFSLKKFIIPFDTFLLKSKIITILKENVWDLILFSSFESLVIFNVNNFV